VLMIVSTAPLRIPRTSRRSLSTATTLYCYPKIDFSVSFIWLLDAQFHISNSRFSCASQNLKEK